MIRFFLLLVLALIAWLTWPQNFNDQLGFFVTMTAMVPFAFPVWLLAAFWAQLFILLAALAVLTLDLR